MNIWDNYPTIKSELDTIKEQMYHVNKSSEKFLDQSLDYLLATGGKMLRPAFVLIGASFAEHEETEKLRNVAAAIETLHMATLVHDDIIDDSEMRRGQPSIQAKYSKSYAVYMGDYLFTQCFMMLSKYEYSRENLFDISRGISKVCIGEMLQHQMRFKTDVRTRDYLKIISGKTAGLFAVSLGIGANIAGAEEKLSKKLARIGYNIGMAFQITDDLLDYNGDDEVVGKDVMKDLLNGYFTLPVIYALKSDKREDLLNIINDPESIKHHIPEAMAAIKSTNGIKRTEALATKYTKRAIKHIQELPECAGKEILMALVPVLLKRNY